MYYTIPINKSCVIFKRNLVKEEENEVCYKTYQDIENFLEAINTQIQECTKRKTKQKTDPLIELSTNIKDNLLLFKDFEEEEKKKETTFNKKQFLVKNSTVPNKEYMLMNLSEHVTTRRQLNKLTESSNVQQFSFKPVKQQKELTYDDLKQMKIEQQRQERERRMYERNKILEEGPVSSSQRLGRKRERISYDEHEHNGENYSVYDEENKHISYDDDINEEEFNNNVNNPTDNGEIVMECFLIYRYQLNQIELEGQWGIANSNTTEKLSYLFCKSNERQRILLSKDDMSNGTSKQLTEQPVKKKEQIFYTTKDLENMFPIDICAANLHELLLINHPKIVSEILKFLSNDYMGYFVYFSKTIEDRFSLKLSLENSLVTIVGEGDNMLGHFMLNGYMNLFRDKEELLRNNNLEDNYIKLGKIKLTKQYVVFNPNENYRVMKSYTHRKKYFKDVS